MAEGRCRCGRFRVDPTLRQRCAWLVCGLGDGGLAVEGVRQLKRAHGNESTSRRTQRHRVEERRSAGGYRAYRAYRAYREQGCAHGAEDGSTGSRGRMARCYYHCSSPSGGDPAKLKPVQTNRSPANSPSSDEAEHGSHGLARTTIVQASLPPSRLHLIWPGRRITCSRTSPPACLSVQTHRADHSRWRECTHPYPPAKVMTF